MPIQLRMMIMRGEKLLLVSGMCQRKGTGNLNSGKEGVIYFVINNVHSINIGDFPFPKCCFCPNPIMSNVLLYRNLASLLF